MLQMMEEFQQPLPHLLHLCVTLLHGGFQIRLLFLTDTGFLNLEIESIAPLPVGDYRRHHSLKPPHPSSHIIITLAHAVNLGPPLMMEQGPIQTNHLPASSLMLGSNDGSMPRQESFRIPARLKHGFMHCAPTGF